MTGSRAQLYNGIMLLATFFCCRLVWGTYQSARVYQDMWAAINHKPAASYVHLDAVNGNSTAALAAAAGKSAVPIHGDTMKFAGEEFVPLWLAFIYLGSNVVLNTLNFYWFAKMVETVRKRFEPPKEDARSEKATATISAGAKGKVIIDVEGTEVRRRKVAEEEPVPPLA
jgi:hypothetical protein